jgi:hypothetical protein
MICGKRPLASSNLSISPPVSFSALSIVNSHWTDFREILCLGCFASLSTHSDSGWHRKKYQNTSREYPTCISRYTYWDQHDGLYNWDCVLCELGYAWRKSRRYKDNSLSKKKKCWTWPFTIACRSVDKTASGLTGNCRKASVWQKHFSGFLNSHDCKIPIQWRSKRATSITLCRHFLNLF